MTRRHGVLDSAAGLVPFGHMGWGYRSRAEFLSRAAEYIVDGLQLNQYIAYAGELTHQGLQSELAAMPGIGKHLESGDIETISAEDYYTYHRGTDIIDAEAVVEQYLAAAEQAIVNGYTGFRAVSDVTPIARTPQQRDTLAHLEYLVDQQMAVHPFSVLCAYDIGQLGAAANELICLHPFVNTGSVMFRLYADADTDADVDFVLAGELDASTGELFDIALQRIWPLVAGNTVRIGAQQLEFISHQQLHLVEECARAHDCHVVIATNQPTINRLAGLLELTHVRVEPTRV